MKKQIQLWLRGVSVAVMAVTLLLMGCNTSTDVSKPAADEAASPAPVVAASSPVASSSSGGLPQESVQVHGHWTIEVRNPDGTLVEVRKFDNALVAGSQVLPKVLGRSNSVGAWRVELRGIPFAEGAFEPDNGSNTAYISENTSTNFSPGHFNNLTVDVPTTGANQNKLVLSGTATAELDGNVGMVFTTLNLLPNTEVPSSSYYVGYAFTSTILPSTIPLLTGQQVLVTVVISFS